MVVGFWEMEVVLLKCLIFARRKRVETTKSYFTTLTLW
jgi:hypothetical protein